MGTLPKGDGRTRGAAAPSQGTAFSVFDYFDYRECLARYFRYRKAMNPRFSYRVFSRRAGYKSAGMYIQIVNGKLNLTREMLSRFIKGMELQGRESEYFSLMVQFTHARTPESRQHWFEKMLPLLPRKARSLTSDQAEYYRNWYNVAVREALSVLDVGDSQADLAELAAFVQPPITPRQAAASLKLLDSLGLVRKDSDHHWRATDAVLESTPALGPFLIHPFQSALIDLGKDALPSLPRDKRNVA